MESATRTSATPTPTHPRVRVRRRLRPARRSQRGRRAPRDRNRRGDYRSGRGARHGSPREVPEVTTMPRTVKGILEHADELAKRFEDYEPSPDDAREPEVFAALGRAVMARSEAERSISQAVTEARSHGYSWRTFGGLLGTPGEAARQRYGVTQKA